MPAFFESMNNILIPRIGKLTVKELVFIYLLFPCSMPLHSPGRIDILITRK